MIRFCKECGALYNDTQGGCPRCEVKRLLEQDPDAGAVDRAMPKELEDRARKSSWIGILIGVPLFIGGIYLIIYIMKLLGS